jgi:DNA-directed RNA polymerase subunit RPC12/RpoP
MGEKLRRFFAGRYGMDALNKLLFIVAALLLIPMWIWNIRYLEILFLLIIVYAYFRTLSRNIRKRYAENQKYLAATAKIRGVFRKKKYRFDQRKTYRFFHCPKCKQQVRVPKGKGTINIRCPKCGEHFVKKS